jgi:glycosyltransferase involved in cell wall biosynthesis
LKKIGFVLNELLPFASISNYVCLLTQQLSKSCSLKIFTFQYAASLTGKTLPSTNTEVFLYNNTQGRTFIHELQTMLFPFGLARKLATNDLLIIVTERPPIMPIIMAKFLNSSLPVVWDFHGITPPSYHKSLQRFLVDSLRLSILKLLIKRSDFRIVHSNFMSRETKRLFKADSIVLPLCVDTSRFQPTKKETVEINRGTFTLLYVGRLVPHKRVDFLIRALAMIKNDHPFRLVVVGSGQDRAKLKKLALSLEVSNYVDFLGEVSDEKLPIIYNASDAFVTASLHEGVCIPILESLASGVPVIIPNNTAMIETAGNASLIYDERSIEDFAGKIKLLSANHDLWLKLRENGLAVASNHSPQKLQTDYQLLIEKIIKQGKCKID